MFTASHKYSFSLNRVPVDFTRNGWKAFCRLNNRLGANFIRAFILKRELAEYIERHLEDGYPMIAEFDVLHEDGIVLTVYLCHGVYYISDVCCIGEVIGHRPYFTLRHHMTSFGWRFAEVLCGWHWITRKTAAFA